MDDDSGIAEPCTDEGIVCEVKAYYDDLESDDENDKAIELVPVTVSTSTVANYITFLKELVCSKALSEEHLWALDELDSGVIGPGLRRQACITHFFK